MMYEKIYSQILHRYTFFRISITIIFCELPGEGKILDFHRE
jgi:hypothetical protein